LHKTKRLHRMISSAVEAGHRNLVNLEQTVIKDDTLLPGEWYGGTMQFDAPSGNAAKNYNITVQIGDDIPACSYLDASCYGGTHRASCTC
jgi:hypothetical protein